MLLNAGVTWAGLAVLCGCLARRRDALAEVFVIRRFGPGVFAEDAIYGAGRALLAAAAIVGIALVVRAKASPQGEPADQDTGVTAGAR